MEEGALAKAVQSGKRESGRNSVFDALRILAAFSVVMLHCAAQFWYELPVEGVEWKIANGYDACFRFGVPLFVMISGALFLNREKNTPVSKLLVHNILRLWIVYFVWSSVYGLWDCAEFGFENLTWKEIVKEILSGRYHLWFLPMIAGIYLLCPVLYEWVHKCSERSLGYFLSLFLIFQIGRSTLICFVKKGELLHLLDTLELPMVCSYLGYFLLGYYLTTKELKPGIRRWLYIGVIPAGIFNILVSTYISLREESPRGEIYDCFCAGTFLVVVALFVFFVQRGEKKSISPAGKKILKEMSENTFGVYLLHLLLLDAFQRAGLTTLSMPVGVGIPVMAVLIFVVSEILAALLRRIPMIGRYLC